jgi:hypothetical protein
MTRSAAYGIYFETVILLPVHPGDEALEQIFLQRLNWITELF